MAEVQRIEKSKSKLRSKQKNKLIFYSIFIAIPVLHFLVFYVYINFNSIVMAFQKYVVEDGKGLVSKPAYFENFKTAWASFIDNPLRLRNSLLFNGINIFIGTPLILLFSFYIYKKGRWSGFYRVILFLPQVLSEVVLGLLYKYLMDTAAPSLLSNLFGYSGSGILYESETRFAATMIFHMMMTFGTNTLIYSSTMSGINPSLIEAAQMDGASPLQEFFHVVFPSIYATMVTMLIVSVSVTFTEQFRVFTLFEGEVGVADNIGYYLYHQAQNSKLWSDGGAIMPYPVLAAYGLILTVITVPVSLGARYALNKVGPKEA